MKPIINPWIIYFAEVSNNLRIVIYFSSLFVFVTAIILNFASMDEVFKEDFKWMRKNGSKVILISLIGLMIAVFLPSKQTVYSMVLLDNITTENIENFKGETKELVDYIVDKMGELENGNQD